MLWVPVVAALLLLLLFSCAAEIIMLAVGAASAVVVLVLATIYTRNAIGKRLLHQRLHGSEDDALHLEQCLLEEGGLAGGEGGGGAGSSSAAGSSGPVWALIEPQRSPQQAALPRVLDGQSHVLQRPMSQQRLQL